MAISNRFIGFNIRQIQDIIDYAEDINLDGILLFLDFKKAFDSIEWNFMNMALKKFGVGDLFIKWVKILHKTRTNSIIITVGFPRVLKFHVGLDKAALSPPFCTSYVPK